MRDSNYQKEELSVLKKRNNRKLMYDPKRNRFVGVQTKTIGSHFKCGALINDVLYDCHYAEYARDSLTGIFYRDEDTNLTDISHLIPVTNVEDFAFFYDDIGWKVKEIPKSATLQDGYIRIKTKDGGVIPVSRDVFKKLTVVSIENNFVQVNETSQRVLGIRSECKEV